MFKNKANEYKEKYQMRASVCLVVLREPVYFWQIKRYRTKQKSDVMNKNFIKKNQNQQSHEMGFCTF